MPMYNLLEHNDNYSMTSGRLWNYYRDDVDNVIDNASDGKSFKVGLSPSKKMCVICFIESPVKMIKNVFYFILKTFFILKIFKFLS